MALRNCTRDEGGPGSQLRPGDDPRMPRAFRLLKTSTSIENSVMSRGENVLSPGFLRWLEMRTNWRGDQPSPDRPCTSVRKSAQYSPPAATQPSSKMRPHGTLPDLSA